MKTLSIKNYKQNLFDFFTSNRSLAGTVFKWVATNTVEVLTKNSLNMPLTGFEKQNTFAPQIGKS